MFLHTETQRWTLRGPVGVCPRISATKMEVFTDTAGARERIKNNKACTQERSRCPARSRLTSEGALLSFMWLSCLTFQRRGAVGKLNM